MILLTGLGGWAWLYSLLVYKHSAGSHMAKSSKVQALGDVTEIIFELDPPSQPSRGSSSFSVWRNRRQNDPKHTPSRCPELWMPEPGAFIPNNWQFTPNFPTCNPATGCGTRPAWHISAGLPAAFSAPGMGRQRNSHYPFLKFFQAETQPRQPCAGEPGVGSAKRDDAHYLMKLKA